MPINSGLWPYHANNRKFLESSRSLAQQFNKLLQHP